MISKLIMKALFEWLEGCYLSMSSLCLKSVLESLQPGLDEGAVYLTSPGRPTDIGLQLGKACYPCSG